MAEATKARELAEYLRSQYQGDIPPHLQDKLNGSIASGGDRDRDRGGGGGGGGGMGGKRDLFKVSRELDDNSDNDRRRHPPHHAAASSSSSSSLTGGGNKGKGLGLGLALGGRGRGREEETDDDGGFDGSDGGGDDGEEGGYRYRDKGGAGGGRGGKGSYGRAKGSGGGEKEDWVSKVRSLEHYCNLTDNQISDRLPINPIFLTYVMFFPILLSYRNTHCLIHFLCQAEYDRLTSLCDRLMAQQDELQHEIALQADALQVCPWIALFSSV